jgi:muramidase (phage lysozyme)
MFADEIASIYVEAKLDRRKYNRDLERLQRERHQVEIEAAYKAGKMSFSSNKQECCDNSDIVRGLVDVKKEIQALGFKQSLNANAFSRLEFALRQRNNQPRENNKYDNRVSINYRLEDKAQFNVMGKEIAASINKGIKGSGGLFDATIGNLFQGIFNDLGQQLTKDFNKGFSGVILEGINGVVGSTSFAGNKLGKEIVQQITGRIPQDLKDNLKKDIEEVLGADDVVVARSLQNAARTQKEAREKTKTREALNLERRQLVIAQTGREQSLKNIQSNQQSVEQQISRGEDLKDKFAFDDDFRRSFNRRNATEKLSKLTEIRQQQDIATENVKVLLRRESEIQETIKQLESAGDIDALSALDSELIQVRSDIKKVNTTRKKAASLFQEAKRQKTVTADDQLKKINSELERLYQARESLVEEELKMRNQIEEANQPIKKNAQLIEQFAPTRLPAAYVQLANEVAGKQISREKLPELVVDDERLSRIGAQGAYSAVSNRVIITSEIKRALEEDRLTKEQYKTLAHELKHAVDFDFGSLEGMDAEREKRVIGKPLVPTTQEYKELYPLIKQYDPEERDYEFNAELHARRLTKKKFDTPQRRDIVAEEYTSKFGQNAEKLQSVIQSQVQQYKEKFKSIFEFGDLKGLDLSDTIAPLVAEFKQLKEESQSSVDDILKIQDLEMPLSEIDKVDENLTKSLSQLELFSKKLRLLELETLQKAKTLVKQPVVIKEPEKVLVEQNKPEIKRANQRLPQDFAVQPEGVDFPTVHKMKSVDFAQSKQHSEAVKKINTDIIENFRSQYNQLKADIKKGQFEFVGENELGALNRAKILLENIGRARQDIEERRQNEGIAKIGTAEASQLNQQLAQLSRMENSTKRTLAKAKLNIESQQQSIGVDDQNLKLLKLPNISTRPFSGDDKKIIQEINKLLNQASVSTEKFDALFEGTIADAEERFNSASEAINNFTENLGNAEDKASGFEKAIDFIGTSADKLLLGFAGFKFIETFGSKLLEFRSIAVEVATEMEQLNNQLAFAGGGGGIGEGVVSQIRNSARDLRLDIRNSMRSAAGVVTAAEGTSVEGQAAVETFTNFQSLLRARGTDKNRAKNFNVALEQAMSKGLQSEELRGQMAEAVPGIIGVFARSQGQSNQQFLNQMRRTTGGLNQQVILEASQQAKAESSLLLEDSLNSTQAAISRLDNSVLELQENAGKLFLPAQTKILNLLAAGADLLGQHFQKLLVIMAAIAVQATAPIWQPLIAGIWAYTKAVTANMVIQQKALGTMGMVRSMASSTGGTLSTIGGELLKEIKPFAATALIIQSLVTLFEGLKIQFSDLGGDISSAAQNSAKGLIELDKAFEETKGLIKEPLPKSGLDIFFNDLAKDPLKVLNPFDNSLRERSKRVVDEQRAVKVLIENSKVTAQAVDDPRVNTRIQETAAIDKRIADLQAKRRGVIQLSPQNTREIKDLQQQESELIKRRFEISKPVALLQREVEQRIKDLKQSQKILDKQKEDGLIIEDNYNRGTRAISTELEKLEVKQEELTKAVGKTKNAYELLRREITRNNTELEDAKRLAEQQSVSRRINLANSNQTQGNQQFIGQSIDIRVLQAQLQAQTNFVNQSRSTFQGEVAQRTLTNLGVNENTGVARINQLAESADEQDKYILEQFANFQEQKLQVQQLQLQVATARQNLRQSLIDQTKQVTDYYQGIERQVKETNIEVNKITAGLKFTDTQNKIRQALTDGADNMFTQFADNLIQQIEAAKNINNRSFDNQSRSLNALNQIQDAQKQGLELRRSLPGELPKIPVELNFEGVDDDANVRSLNEEFKNTQEELKFIDKQINDVSGLLDTNIGQNQKINNELKQQVNDTSDIKRNIDAGNSSADTFRSTTAATASVTGEVKNGFSSIVDWINQSITATQLWWNKLIEGNEILKNIGNTFNNIVQNSGNFLQQGVSNLQQAAQSDVNQVVGALGGNQYGIASPSTTQSLKQVLGGSVLQSQGFFGGRTRGIHASIDFDNTEGLGGLAQFNAMFPGQVTSLRQWGSGYKDKESGRESNAIRVKSKLPGINDYFYTDYGHYLRDTAKVQEGQNIGPGQRLGQLAKDDTGSNGGHLDLKIRVPSSIANQFKTKTVDPKSRNMVFVEVKEFMSWYQNHLGKVPQASQELPPLRVTVSDNATSRKTFGESPKNTQQTSVNGIRRGGNELTQAEYNRLTPEGKQLYQLRNNPNIWAMADTVARAEGTDFRSNSKNFGYTMMIGGEHDTDLSRHPFAGNQGSRIRPPRHNSTASGRYQMMDFNYSRNRARQQFGSSNSDLSKIFQGENPGSFSPGVQDLYFIASLKSRGVLDEVLAGNFQGALSNRQIALHYASLQAGNAKSAHSGQGTPEGQLRNTVPFAQQRAAARRARSQRPTNIAQTAVSRNSFISPQQMQQQVQVGENQQIASIQQREQAQRQQEERERQREEAEFKRTQERNLRQLRRSTRDLGDRALDNRRQITDKKFEATPIRSREQNFQMEATKIVREYDDLERSRTRDLEETQQAIKDGQKLLATLPKESVKERAEVEKSLQQNIKFANQLQGEIKTIQETRATAISEASRIKNRTEFERERQLEYDNLALDIERQKQQLQQLQTQQAIRPDDKTASEINQLQQQISLKENDLQLNREIAEISDKVFKKELSREEGERLIANQRRVNEERKKGIELTYQQVDAERELARQQLALEKRAVIIEAENALKQESIREIEIAQRRNPLTRSGEQFDIQKTIAANQAQIETERKQLEIQQDRRYTDEEKAIRINHEQDLYQRRLRNIELEHQFNIDNQAVANLETGNARNQRLAEFTSGSLLNRLELQAKQNTDLGGNQFVSNAINRDAGRLRENIRYQQETSQLDANVARMRLEGFDITEQQVANIKTDLAEINKMNLAGIDQQFKTFGQTLNEVVGQSFRGLSQSITDLILKGGSLTDVFDNLVNNILSGVLNMGLNSLFGGLFGGAGGLFGGLFADGGEVGRSKLDPRNIHQSLATEKRKSGRNPYLIVAHEGEMLIPYSRMQELRGEGVGEKELLGFASGGLVGSKLSAPGGMSKSSNNSAIRVETIRINNQEYVTTDQMQAAMEQAAAMGGNRGVEMVQDRLQNDSAFRSSVGVR